MSTRPQRTSRRQALEVDPISHFLLGPNHRRESPLTPRLTRAVGAAVVISSALAGPLKSQSIPQQQDSTLVAATSDFRFHSDFWHNLSDFLYWRAQEDGPRDVGAACIATQPDSVKAGWHAAEAYYAQEMGARHHRTDPLLRALRYTLSGVAEFPDSLVQGVFEVLSAAAPAYQSCFWARQNTLNRERVANLVPLLVRFGPELTTRMAELYQEAWPAAIHVDVLPYASFAGANTASGPNIAPHMAFSSIDPDLADLSGLELLLHESSHEMFGARHGTIGEAINAIADSLGVRVPRNLWHAISFYTSGQVMQDFANQIGRNYEPYWSRSGVFQRAWPEYLQPLRDHWTLYLTGDIPLETALHDLILELTKGDGEDETPNQRGVNLSATGGIQHIDLHFC